MHPINRAILDLMNVYYEHDDHIYIYWSICQKSEKNEGIRKYVCSN